MTTSYCVIRDNPWSLQSLRVRFHTKCGCPHISTCIYESSLDVLKLALYALAHHSLTSRLVCQNIPITTAFQQR